MTTGRPKGDHIRYVTTDLKEHSPKWHIGNHMLHLNDEIRMYLLTPPMVKIRAAFYPSLNDSHNPVLNAQVSSKLFDLYREMRDG
jgi:hypothetical protein